MAAIIDGKLCGSCGEWHTLCLPAGDTLDGDKMYEFVCPTSGAVVRFFPGDVFERTDPAHPRDSVVIRPVAR
jgi:hypothetical protein